MTLNHILKFKEDYFPLIINIETLNPNIEDEHKRLCLVTYCYFRCTNPLVLETQLNDLCDKELIATYDFTEEENTLIHQIKQSLEIVCQRQRILYYGEVLELHEIYGIEQGEKVPSKQNSMNQSASNVGDANEVEEEKVVDGQKITNGEFEITSQQKRDVSTFKHAAS